MAQIMTDKRKLRLLRIYLFDSANAFYGLGLGDITPHTIYRIRWVNNHSATLQTLYDRFQMTGIRILRMKFQKHEFLLNDEKLPFITKVVPFLKLKFP
jgi:hypothetical protein